MIEIVLQVVALMAYVGASGTVARGVYKLAVKPPHNYRRAWAFVAAAFAFLVAPTVLAGVVTHQYMEDS